MGLRLILGPARSGKATMLREEFVAESVRGALLVVRSREAVARAEHDLLDRHGVLFGGGVTTFDGVVHAVLARTGETRTMPAAERHVRLARVLGRMQLDRLGAATASPGFVRTVGRLFDRLGSALIDPRALAVSAGSDVGRELARVYGAWFAEQDAAGAHDQGRRRIEAARALEQSISAWDGRALFVEGFEDLSAAQEAIVRSVADRAHATVSLPYEPGRAVFAAVRPLVERLADRAEVVELSPRADASVGLVALERRLYAGHPVPGTIAQDGVALLEAVGGRAEAELVIGAVAGALRAGVAPDAIAVVTPTPARPSGELVEAFDRTGIPYALDAALTVRETGFGFALDRLLLVAFDREHAMRGDLFAFLRSPWSGLRRRFVDDREGILRSRGIDGLAPALAAIEERLGGPVRALATLGEGPPVDAVRRVVRQMLAADGVRGEPVRTLERDDVSAALSVLDGLQDLASVEPSGREIRDAIAGMRVRGRLPTPGRVLVRDLQSARGLDVDTVILAGFERRSARDRAGSTFLPDTQRALLERHEPDAAELDRLHTYVACTRARTRLVVISRVGDDDGRPTPRTLLVKAIEDALGTLPVQGRRGLDNLTFEAAEAPDLREFGRALAVLAGRDPARARAIADRCALGAKLERAERAFTRIPALRHPAVVGALRERRQFSVTDLEKYHECSAWWFVERYLRPSTEIDGAFGALEQGTVAHRVLQRFFTEIEVRFGRDRLGPDDRPEIERFVDELIADAVGRLRFVPDALDVRVGVARLRRDILRFILGEVDHPGSLRASRFEVSIALRLGDVDVTGKVDRIDTDPLMSARALIQDYKTGKSAWSAPQIREQGRLQLPLYIEAARTQLGLDPIGGLYRAIGPGGSTAGVIDEATDPDVLPRDVKRDSFVDAADLDAMIADARAQARAAIDRIRIGRVTHDPPDGTCPFYCEWSGVCRVPSR